MEDAASIAELLRILKQENTEEPSFTKAQAQEEKDDKAEPDDHIESESEESQTAFATGSQTSGASGGKGKKGRVPWLNSKPSILKPRSIPTTAH